MADANPDPSTLTDEELDAILTGEEPEEPTEENPKEPEVEAEPEAEPKTPAKKEEEPEEPEDPAEPEEEPETPPEEEPKKEEPKKPSRREQRRIQDLLQKYGDPEEKKAEPPKRGIDYTKELDADEETLKRLEEDRSQVASSEYDRGLAQAKSVMFHTRLEIDAPRVEQKYPQLDKNSEQFKPEAANDVNMLYLRLCGFDPKTNSVQNADIRYGDFIDTVFTLVNDLKDDAVKEAVQSVKKQAAKTGLRPDGSGSKKLNLNKAPDQMSDEELDAYLDQAIPKR